MTQVCCKSDCQLAGTNFIQGRAYCLQHFHEEEHRLKSLKDRTGVGMISADVSRPLGPVKVEFTDKPTEVLLAERGKTHGDFSHHATCTQALKSTCQSYPNWNALGAVKREALEMILHKIGRIMAGDPNHKDHWDDIAGYARLVSERL